MSKPTNLKLEKLPHHNDEQPHISVVGHGKNTFLWVGAKGCYAYSKVTPEQLHRFAEAIIRRVMQPYKKAEKKR